MSDTYDRYSPPAASRIREEMRQARMAQRLIDRAHGFYTLAGTDIPRVINPEPGIDHGYRELYGHSQAMKEYAHYNSLGTLITLTEYASDGTPLRYLRNQGELQGQWIDFPDGQK